MGAKRQPGIFHVHCNFVLGAAATPQNMKIIQGILSFTKRFVEKLMEASIHMGFQSLEFPM